MLGGRQVFRHRAADALNGRAHFFAGVLVGLNRLRLILHPLARIPILRAMLIEMLQIFK